MSIKQVDFSPREFVTEEQLVDLFPEEVIETYVLVKTPDGWMTGNTELSNAHEVIGMLQVAASELIEEVVSGVVYD